MLVLHKDGPVVVAALVLSVICVMLAGCGSGSHGGGHDHPGNSGQPAFDLVESGLKSVSYAPMYLQNQSCIDEYTDVCGAGFLTDDFAAQWAEPIWDDSGRGDLANIASLGANALRLYGNDPRFEKKDFLDAAKSHGLQAITGLSSYWYNGGKPSPQCAITGVADCHDAIRDSYVQNLQKGFLDSSKRYHPAIAIIDVMNEPDFLGDMGHMNYLKAVLSGLDGILSAEKAQGVQPWTNGKLPRLTATWSFALAANGKEVCTETYHPFIQNITSECGPGLTFMVQFYRVVQDPKGTLGYTPKNDIAAAFKSRFINSFNTFVDAEQIQLQFMEKYNKLSFFKGVHVYCGEWNPRPVRPQKELVKDLKALFQPGEPFIGVSYFQYQVAYNKNGTERDFGMLKLGKSIIGHTGWIQGDSQKDHPINCLMLGDTASHAAESLAEAWGGRMPIHGMCSSFRSNSTIREAAVLV
mmetsp:Transcript_34800/g.62697  ORF Transcript_34800/g.62697 Transcript_34800/m.62697 type:complete len:467 (-) Transcript_34800:37-1437(-)